MRRPDKYILDGHEAVVCDDLFEWCKWMEDADRHVALSIQGDVRVSTVFLGLDHHIGGGDAPPILFETMTFVGGDGGFEEGRYSTWSEAVEGHKRTVDRVFKPTPILPLPR